ncbi:MAG TPA: hypothetical protein PK537_00565, partial [Candidatus Limiplasma sp.]|nr:hypothetical protein [Candidatus Limiplasma sp.]
MMIRKSPLLHKAFWLLVAIFLMAVQPAFATELTDDELQAMPAVSITYYTQEGGDPLTAEATPGLCPLGKAYWATLPQEAFSYPVTLTIIASETTMYTFEPQTGAILEKDINTTNYDGIYTLITAYENDQMVDSYYLYLSAEEMPPAVAPVQVPVYYVDSEDNGNILYSELVTAYYDQENIVTVNTDLVPANYALISNASAAVTVNDQGQASPEWITFYFEAQIMQGTVHVYYKDAAGNEVASAQTKTLDPGTYTVSPEPSDLEAGYTLSADNPASVEVTVDTLGNASPEAITFVYEPAITTGYVTVNYTDENGAELISSETLEYATGTHIVTPNTTRIPSGYVLSDSSPSEVSVTVDSIGGVIPTFVTFVYKAEQTTPAQGDLIVYYTDTSGTQIVPSEIQTLSQGQHVVVPTASIPSDYTLSATSPSEYTVTVDATGAVSPLSVTFVYEKVTQQVITGTLTILYVDASGTQIATPQTVTLGVGTSVIGIEESTIPAGYALTEGTPDEYTVTVDESGNVSPSTISFTLAVTQTDNYTLTPVESFAKTNKADVNFRTSPDSTGTANIAFASVAQGTQVWVYGTFVTGDREWASINYANTDCYVWNSLIDLVTQQQEPVSGTLTIQYHLANGDEIASDQTVSLDAGSHVLTPDTVLIPAGYALADGSPAQYTVTVDESGNVSPATITFTYAAEAAITDPTAYAGYTAVGANAVTNDTGVRLRSEPSTATLDNIVYQVTQGTTVWVYGTFPLDGTQWAYVSYESTDCFVWYSLLDAVSTEPESGTLTVRYATADGTQIATDQTVTLDAGAYSVSPDANHIPSGYSPAEGADTHFTVTVDDSGVVSPDTVTFIYAADTAVITDPTTYADYTVVGANAVTNTDAVNFRTAPDTAADIAVAAAAKGTQVWINGTFTADGNTWAYILYGDMDCYVVRSYLDLVGDEPVTGTLNVQYQVTGNTALSSAQTLTLEAGSTYNITPDVNYVPTGYSIAAGTDAQFTVVVDANGNVSPDTITFTLAQSDPTAAYADYTAVGADAVTNDTGVRLRSEPSTATLDTVIYQVTQGTTVWVYGTFTLDGTQWAYVHYADTDCYVWYSLLDLVADETATGSLTVQYQLAGGADIADSQTVNLSQGTSTVMPDASAVPSGYVLTATSPTQVEVTVDADGSVSPNPITFIYEAQTETADTGKLTVQYQLADGTKIADNQILDLDAGTYNVTPDASHIPDGYQAATNSQTQFTVTVDSSGLVSPNPITFLYVAEATETPADEHTDISGNYDDYTMIGIAGITNDTGVRLRSTPTSASITNILYQVTLGTPVWVYGTFTRDGTLWAYVSYDGTDCYVWYSLLDVDESAIPVRGTLTVRYHLPDGSEIVSDQALILAVGTYTVEPDTQLVPAGYYLSDVSATQVEVTVDSSGNVSPNPVTFLYEKEPSTGTLTIQYQLADGTKIASDQTRTLSQGTYIIVPDTSLISSEYVISSSASAQVEVTVDAAGSVSPNPVTFLYIVNTADTPPVDISGEYADYTEIGVTAVTNTTAVNLRSTPKSTITTNIISKVPLGTTVWVHGSFTVDDRMWAYVRYADVDCYVWYSLLTLGEKETPATGTLSVQYRLADGSSIAADQTLTLEAGTHTITPDSSLVPSGYVLAASSAPQFSITVDESGNISSDTVTFVYEQEVVTGALVVQYHLDNGTAVASSQTLTLGVGTHTITPDTSLIPSGYVLTAASATQFSVTVDQSGNTNPGSVTFFYEKQVITGTLTIQYLVGDADVITPQTQTLNVGTYMISVDESLIPSGFELASSSTTSYTVTVDTSGNVSPNPIVFQLVASATDSDLEMYVGYAVTTTQVALRNDANFEDSSILTTLDAGTLLYLSGQVDANGTVWTGAQTYLGDSVIGLLPYDSVETLSAAEAQVYIDEYNQAHTTTTQKSGYYLTLGDNVPLRNVPGTQASVSAWIAEDQVVYVTEQVYYDNYTWDVSYYGTQTGYIRDDQIRAMSTSEVADYLANASPTATPAQTVSPYDEDSASSYGYITTDSVNFRQTAGGTRIGVLNEYAFGLVLGSTYVNNTLWYNINQSGTTGWVSGDYFKVLSLSELTDFLNSSEYLQGIYNSSSTTTSTT